MLFRSGRPGSVDPRGRGFLYWLMAALLCGGGRLLVLVTASAPATCPSGATAAQPICNRKVRGSSPLFGSELVPASGLVESYAHRVDAVAVPGRGLRSVLEYVTQVRFAAAALCFDAVHAMGMIRRIDDALLADGFIETGPAATAFKLCIAFKQCVAASGAIVSSYVVKIFKLTAPRPFGSFFAGYIINIFR